MMARKCCAVVDPYQASQGEWPLWVISDGTLSHVRVMSALPPKTDMCGAQAHVRFGRGCQVQCLLWLRFVMIIERDDAVRSFP